LLTLLLGMIQSPLGTYSFEGCIPEVSPIPEAIVEPATYPRTVTVYLNERYSPRLGFCTKGLILGDRGAFSDNDGLSNFSTIEEAESGLTSKGWVFEGDDWMVLTTFGEQIPLSKIGEDEGWYYSTDFAGYSNSVGHDVKGMTHFVRRRKLQRVCVYDERVFLSDEMMTCDHCDQRRVDQLVPILLDTLWQAMRGHYGTKTMKPDKIMKMKDLMIDAVFKKRQNTFSHNMIAQILQDFARSKGCKTGESCPTTEEGLVILEAFPEEERRGLSRAIIRSFDQDFSYHCVDRNCGIQCSFAKYRCGNTDCSVTFSRKWFGEHDASCPNKIIACPLGCSRIMYCKMSADHAQHECINRPVPCPYAHFGCTAPGLIFKDVQEHCADNMEPHLDLSTGAINKMILEINALGEEGARLQACI